MSASPVRVSSLPLRFQPMFQFSEFNAVQSASFDFAFNSDTNMVVSAPTGCGKTVIAELALLRSICTRNSPALMLYVSPLRSLCQERVRDWKNRLIGCDVQEYTGDSNTAFPSKLESHTLLCTTPEKIDLATRSWRNRLPIFQNISLVIIDEVHLLAESRGAILEAMVSRLLYISDHLSATMGTAPIRLIALSATIPNYADIANWLRVPKDCWTKFGDNYRSTKLSMKVLGFRPAKNDWIFENSLSQRLPSIIRQYGDSKPILIFCCTRKSCEKTANYLIETFPELRTKVPISGIADKSLQQCLLGGVGFHTAGLSPNDRAIVESLFMRMEIRILCTTSTLSQGINLPAHLVIVKGTKHYTDAGLVNYESSQILQMAGRAGRPQYNDEGVCVILTETTEVRRYEDLVNNSKEIESSLMPNLTEHMNAEIALGTICCKEDVIRWLRSTFLYIRIFKNPLYYGLSGDIETSLEQRAMDVLSLLCAKNFVQLDGDKVLPLPKSSLCSQNGVMIETMNLFDSATPTDLHSTLRVLCKASEFNDFVVRQDEKQRIRLFGADPAIRFPDADPSQPDFFSPETKVYILLQYFLGRGKPEEWSLAQDIAKITKIADRLLSCLFLLMVDKRRFSGAVSASTLSKCVRAGLWEDGSDRVAMQIAKIGEISARKLHQAGITSFPMLRRTKGYQFERILSHKTGWSFPVTEDLNSVPEYRVEIEQSGSDYDIVVRNVTETDPACFIKAAILVGNTATDELLGYFAIKRVVGHGYSKFQIACPADPEDVVVHVVDSKYVGIDVCTPIVARNWISDDSWDSDEEPVKPGHVKATAPADDEEVVWQMPDKKADTPAAPLDKVELSDDFWDNLDISSDSDDF